MFQRITGRQAFGDVHAGWCSCNACKYPADKSDSRFLVYGVVIGLILVGVLLYA